MQEGCITADNEPNSIFGADGFLFDIAKETTIELTSDITDYYTEDNTAIQDHIALKPIVITLSGFQGELVSKTDVPLSANYGIVKSDLLSSVLTVDTQRLTQKMDILNPFNAIMPTQIAQARQAISNAADNFDKYRSITKQYYGILTNDITYLQNKFADFQNKGKDKMGLRGKEFVPTRQQLAYELFELLWKRKTLCTVETPYKTYSNMAIQTISTRQSEDSIYVSDFSITFKQMNFAQTEYSSFDAKQFQGTVAKAQRSEIAEMGKSQGKQQDESILHSMFGGK